MLKCPYILCKCRLEMADAKFTFISRKGTKKRFVEVSLYYYGNVLEMADAKIAFINGNVFGVSCYHEL